MVTEYSMACCTTPVAVVGDYTEKGRWIEVDGLKTYITGPETASKAIVYIYDVFGFSPQSIQGADILAYSASTPQLVIMPDFFDKRAAKPEWLADRESEPNRSLLMSLIQHVMSDEMKDRVEKIVVTLKSNYYPDAKRWAAVGFCWGSKMVSVMTAKAEKSVLDLGAHSSPSQIDPEDAKSISVPTVVLASKDEDEALVKQYVENLVHLKDDEKYLERFAMVHGWMSARADLDKDEPRAEYERGYKILIDFFEKHL